MRNSKPQYGPAMSLKAVTDILAAALPKKPIALKANDGNEALYVGLPEAAYEALLLSCPAMKGGYTKKKRDCENIAKFVSAAVADAWANLYPEDEVPLLAQGNIEGLIPVGHSDRVEAHADLWFIDEQGRARLADAQKRVVLPPDAFSRIKECWFLEVV